MQSVFRKLNCMSVEQHTDDSQQQARPFTKGQASQGGPIRYRYVNQGSGGTYTFTPDTLQYIGTSKCISCVGVYFAIDDSRCFVAHINADAVTRSGNPSRMTNERLAAKIHDQVTEKLNAEQQKAQWGPVTERMRSSLVMVCPHMGWKWPMVGDAVSAAVQEWLGIIEPPRPSTSGGFIIRHYDGQVELFEVEAPPLQWFKHDEDDNGAWAILVRDE